MEKKIWYRKLTLECSRVTHAIGYRVTNHHNGCTLQDRPTGTVALRSITNEGAFPLSAHNPPRSLSSTLHN